MTPVHPDCVFSARLNRGACLACLLTLAILQGCATPGMPAGANAASVAASAVRPATKTAPAPAVPDPVPAVAVDAPELVAQQLLTAGIDAYNRGEYTAAIRRLTASDIAAGEKSVQITAHKFAAFSYCLTKRQTQCRQQFDKAFRLDPAFDLAPGEKGHPLWGPPFEASRKANNPKGLRRCPKHRAPCR